MYQNKEWILLQKTPHFITYWIFFLFCCLIFIFGILFCKIKPRLYYQGFVTKIGNQYYIKIYSNDHEVGKLNNKEVFLNGDKYPLAYTKIKESYTISNSLENVHEVLLSLSLPKKLKFENKSVEILFEQEETTIMNMILKKWKQGVYEAIR